MMAQYLYIFLVYIQDNFKFIMSVNLVMLVPRWFLTTWAINIIGYCEVFMSRQEAVEVSMWQLCRRPDIFYCVLPTSPSSSIFILNRKEREFTKASRNWQFLENVVYFQFLCISFSGMALGAQLPSVLTVVKKGKFSCFWLKCYTFLSWNWCDGWQKMKTFLGQVRLLSSSLFPVLSSWARKSYVRVP